MHRELWWLEYSEWKLRHAGYRLARVTTFRPSGRFDRIRASSCKLKLSTSESSVVSWGIRTFPFANACAGETPKKRACEPRSTSCPCHRANDLMSRRSRGKENAPYTMLRLLLLSCLALALWAFECFSRMMISPL